MPGRRPRVPAGTDPCSPAAPISAQARVSRPGRAPAGAAGDREHPVVARRRRPRAASLDSTRSTTSGRQRRRAATAAMARGSPPWQRVGGMRRIDRLSSWRPQSRAARRQPPSTLPSGHQRAARRELPRHLLRRSPEHAAARRQVGLRTAEAPASRTRASDAATPTSSGSDAGQAATPAAAAGIGARVRQPIVATGE